MTNEIEILMADNCTESEAIKHLARGTVIFDDLEQNLETYVSEWFSEDAGWDEDDAKEEADKIREMVSTHKPAQDWGVVEIDGKTYFIQYVL